MDELLSGIPEEFHPRIREICTHTDQFCHAHLNEEFRDICREVTVMAMMAGIAMDRGKAAAWAAGVVATVGFANFLGDPTQPYHITQDEMARTLGISLATLHNKLNVIRETLHIVRLDPQLCSQSLNEKNPLVWMLKIDGMIADARRLSPDEQRVAFDRGQIPYIPAVGPGDVRIRHWMPTKSARKGSKRTGKPSRSDE